MMVMIQPSKCAMAMGPGTCIDLPVNHSSMIPLRVVAELVSVNKHHVFDRGSSRRTRRKYSHGALCAQDACILEPRATLTSVVRKQVL